MSEYWKSTPSYWCKFCSTYVRDTPVSRSQHEATGRHQGNIQRSLRNLHKDQDREERDKQRAKDEVARLNGLVGGKPTGGAAATTTRADKKPAPAAAPAKATLEERKRQMRQLADMGVAVPDEFKKEMAVAGEWQTISTRRVEKKEPDRLVKAEPGAESFGVRKRKLEDAEGEDEGAPVLSKAPEDHAWGTKRKAYRATDEADVDFAALMAGGSSQETPSRKVDTQQEDVKEETDVVKYEQSPPPKQDLEAPSEPAVVFKKRKVKGTKT